MSWVLSDDSDKAIIEEIERQSDRGVMIVGTALLETRLEAAILSRLKPDITPDEHGKFFKSTGPMATLSAKIDAGYLLQIYPKESQTLLHKLRDIRNDAAHETSGVNFETQSIRDRCENLAPLVDDAEFQNVKHWFGLNRVAAELAPQSLWPPQEYRAITDEGEVETNTVGWGYDDARSCFIAGLKSQIFHLHQVTRIFEGIRLVLPPLPDTPK